MSWWKALNVLAEPESGTPLEIQTASIMPLSRRELSRIISTLKF
jgi:hypothetical protein